ncbi:MAG: hypothetical protein ACTSUT_06950 [Promethearchaeota archaeon]
MKFKDLSLKYITTIQISIATIISLLFQFLIPYSWQPLDAYRYGAVPHGTEGTNLVFFTLSQWFFSLSIAWLLYRDNPYINNYLIYNVISLSLIIIYEFSVLLFYDYIHIFPVIVGIFIMCKKRETLSRKFIPYIMVLIIIWHYFDYFFKLAYYQKITLIEFTINLAIIIGLNLGFSLILIKKENQE